LTTEALLGELLQQAGLPAALSWDQIIGRGFENKIYRVALTDGREVLLREYPAPRESEQQRAAFLEGHGVPAPRLFASSTAGALYEFVPGVLLGDLIETGRATATTWRLVGEAFAHIHEIKFPARLCGEIQAGQAVLHFNDPVAQMHHWIEESIPGLRQRAPAALPYLPQLHEIVDRAATALQEAPAALSHGDISMWNIIVGTKSATLIDWDLPLVRAPALEIALLDKHAWLFNGRGIPSAFFEGYGQPPTEPTTSLYRVVHTINWAASADWEEFEQLDLPTAQIERTRQWLRALIEYTNDITTHLEHLQRLI
jgi:aminoglycoside phosphotransferase (APT) family kinase protein